MRLPTLKNLVLLAIQPLPLELDGGELKSARELLRVRSFHITFFAVYQRVHLLRDRRLRHLHALVRPRAWQSTRLHTAAVGHRCTYLPHCQLTLRQCLNTKAEST